MTPPFRPYIVNVRGVVHNGACADVSPKAQKVRLTNTQALVYRKHLSPCPVCIGPVVWNRVRSGLLTIDEPAEVPA